MLGTDGQSGICLNMVNSDEGSGKRVSTLKVRGGNKVWNESRGPERQGWLAHTAAAIESRAQGDMGQLLLASTILHA